MENSKKSKFKNLIENIKRPFSAIFGADDNDEQEIQLELENLQKIQAGLQEEKDYNSNIHTNTDFVQKVNLKGKKISAKKMEKELKQEDLAWEK